MCLVVFAWNIHPEYKLIFASNRDEFYERPTKELGFWEDQPTILAGRDMKARGTWLGVNKKGKLAAITNYRDPKIIKQSAPSRGNLTTNFLLSEIKADKYLQNIKPTSNEYNGFNLIMYDNESLCYYSNIENKIKKLSPSIYGISNHLLDTPWSKVENLKQNFKTVIYDNKNKSALSLTSSLFKILKNDFQPIDEDLPKTGVSIEWERAIAPIFIKTETYGTSSSAVVLYNRKGDLLFTEKRYLDKDQSELSFNIPIS